MRQLILATVFALTAMPALADPPEDVVDLIGARAPGAEAQMQARGYVDAQGNNVWWNQKTGICAKVQVSGGHYRTIDMVDPIDCGIKALGESEEAAPRAPSQAAVDACMNAADALFEEEAGASRLHGRPERSGENWVITLRTEGETSRCTVTQAGSVVSMDR
ncbi:MAG: hypothetical protein ABW151_03005 [Pseudorhodoplanes sp.]